MREAKRALICKANRRWEQEEEDEEEPPLGSQIKTITRVHAKCNAAVISIVCSMEEQEER